MVLHSNGSALMDSIQLLYMRLNLKAYVVHPGFCWGEPKQQKCSRTLCVTVENSACGGQACYVAASIMDTGL